MTRTRVLVVLSIASLSLGCATEVYPDRPYFDVCTSDATCGPSYRCLPWSLYGAPRMVCSVACTSVSQCPPVTTQHCGTQTVCESGVCGYRPCR